METINMETISSKERLQNDMRSVEFEIEQIAFEFKALDVARWRKIKELHQRKETALQELEQLRLLEKEVD